MLVELILSRLAGTHFRTRFLDDVLLDQERDGIDDVFLADTSPIHKLTEADNVGLLTPAISLS